LVAEYLEADGRVSESIQAAPAREKADALRARRDLRPRFADRFLSLGRGSAADLGPVDAAIDSLTWVIVHCPGDRRGREAVERMLRGPIANERLGGVCQRLDAEESPLGEPIYRAVLASNTHASARAHASLALAAALRRRSEGVGPDRGERAAAAERSREAESVLEEAIARDG
jgi:hypothetical protein